MKSSCFYALLLVIYLTSCSQPAKPPITDPGQLTAQLETLKGLLRDSAFAFTIAAAQEATYYTALGQPVPPFSNGESSMLKKSVKEEKIATNLAGLYATECAIGLLVAQNGKTPVYWLQQIKNGKPDSAEILIVNRFANATWKAGQPFRGLSRIKRENFTVANFLSVTETQKDYDQIVAASLVLLDSLLPLADKPAEDQFRKISILLKDKKFAFETAKYMEASYYTALKQPIPPFLTTAEDTATISRDALHEKVATNIAGFYALECGLSYLASAKKILPSNVIQSILDSSISREDKELLERFANATWKAGQPFRGLDRITRDNFTPFALLSKEEIEKDWVQIKSVAGLLKGKL